MAYDLQLQIALQPDKASLDNLAKQVQSRLSGIQVSGIDAQALAKANSQIKKTTGNLNKADDAAQKFWDRVQGKGVGFAAYTVASQAILKLTGAVVQATRESIKFESELIKISQVTNRVVKGIQDESKALFDISKRYNVTITKVAELTRTLTQTGLSFRDAAKGAEVLAKTSLLATFESLTSTTEGLIATMQTFNLTVEQSGKVLEKINAVSKAFAVESSDIVEAIRRTGGAFSAAGGQVEELIALFTSVRSTSRESAETIATGFRTIFGRLQRPKTIEYFKQLGIQLETAQGQFVGPLKAIENISSGLEKLGIRAGSIRFAEVVEQIGGIRQLSRVVPLLEQYRKTQQALAEQNKASGSTARDLAKAQQGLGYQLGVLKQEFTELISDVVNSASFKTIAQTFIGITKTVLALTNALKPLLPLITAIATIKIGRGLSKLVSGGFSLKGMKGALGFASGGMVPGTGDRDTVPAMLTPGEFVIRKSAVKAFGANRLASINKYKKGGNVVAAKKDKVLDGDSIRIEYASDPYLTSTRLIGVDAYEINQGTEAERAKGEKARKIATRHYRGKTDLLPLFKDHGQDKFGRPKFKDDALANKLLKAGVAVPYSGSGSRATKGTKLEGYAQEKANGGLVQKFAEGGKATKLTHDEISALRNYIQQGSKGVNKFLSGRPLSREEEVLTGVPGISGMSYPDRILLLDGLVRDQVPSTLYMGFKSNRRKLIEKGVDNLPEGLLGKTFSFPGFSSTSSAFESAASFSGGYTGGVMSIKTKPDGKGIDVLQTLKDAGEVIFNTARDEKEFILPRGSSFKVNQSQVGGSGLDLQVQQLAKGGPVGTDTVPALLTPGEFVVNKKSAQAFGYGNLRKINRYAQGGVVDGVQYFEDGGTVLSKEEKKRRREQYKKEQLGTSLSRGERTGGVFAGIEAKYDKLLEQESKFIIDIYEEKIKTAMQERKSIVDIIMERNRQLEDAEKANRLGMEAAKKEAQATIDKKVLDDASGALVILGNEAKDAAKEVKDLAKENKRAKLTITELIFYQQSAAQSLKNFAGITINEEALQASSLKAGKLDILSQTSDVFVKNFDNWNNTLKQAAVNMRAYNGKYSGIVKGLGNGILKTTGFLDKIGPKILGLAKGIGIVGKVMAVFELAGGLIDSIFGKDYGKAKEGFIEAGDAAQAGAMAAKEYNQRFFRGIPVLGGFISAAAESTGLINMELDARGELVVATAELRANTVRLSQDFDRASDSLSNALIRGNKLETQNALGRQSEIISSLKSESNALNASAMDLQKQGPDLFTKVLAGAGLGAAGGATAGVIGSLATGGITALPAAGIGAVIGGISGGVTAFTDAIYGHTNDIVAAYEASGEAYKAAGEMMKKRIETLGSEFSSLITNTILAGGSLEDAGARIKETFGDQAFQDVFGDMDLNSANLEVAIKSMGVEIDRAAMSMQGMSSNIRELQNAVDNAWEPAFYNLYLGTKNEAREKLAAAERAQDVAEAEQELQKQRQQVLIQAQVAAKNAEILAYNRKLENDAMRESIRLMKVRIAVFDELDMGILGLEEALESVSAAAEGRSTRQQILDSRGSSIQSTTLRMDPEQILRTSMGDPNSPFMQMVDALSRIDGKLAGQLVQGKKDLDMLDELSDRLSAGGDLSSDISNIVMEAQDAARESGTADGGPGRDVGQKIAERLMQELPAMISPGMKAAINQLGQDLAEGLEAGSTIEEIKDKLTEEQKQLIEKVQQVNEKMLDMEQELFKRREELSAMRIEQIDREYALTKQIYDAEMDYLNKRLALNEKVDDVLEELPVGPGRAAAIGERAAKRREDRMAGIGNAREAAGLPADTRGREGSFFEGVAGYRGAADAAMARQGGPTEGETRALSQTFAELEQEGQLLLHTLQDEIDAEQQYLDGLIEMAKAQQDYTQTLYDAQGDLVRELITGTEEEAGDLLQGLNAALIAGQQGSFAGVPEDLKKQVFSVFDAFGDVVIPGLGVTGRDAQREIAKNELMRNYGLDQATAEQLASKAVKDRVPIDERMKEMIELQEKKIMELLEREKMLNDYMARLQSINNQLFAVKVDKFASAVDAFAAAIEAMWAKLMDEQQDRENPGLVPNEPAPGNDQPMPIPLPVEITNPSGLDGGKQRHEAIPGDWEGGLEDTRTPEQRQADQAAADARAARTRQQVENTGNGGVRNPVQTGGWSDWWNDTLDWAAAPVNWMLGSNSRTGYSFAKGGIVYAANGGAMDMSNIGFKPKGTDTVPAMLTPGEFVVNKKATNKNRGLLEDINDGKYTTGTIGEGLPKLFSEASPAAIFANKIFGIDSNNISSIIGNGAGVMEFVRGGGSFANSAGMLKGLGEEIADSNQKFIQMINENHKEKALDIQLPIKPFDYTGSLNRFAKGGYVKPKYLAQGGSTGPYRSQGNINRYGASDPRFEQGGLRGLDPSSPYYQDALAYWQYIMAWQNQYNQRAAYWNEGIRAQQMQAMQMMLTNWGYYAKGGYVKPKYLRKGGYAEGIAAENARETRENILNGIANDYLGFGGEGNHARYEDMNPIARWGGQFIDSMLADKPGSLEEYQSSAQRLAQHRADFRKKIRDNRDPAFKRVRRRRLGLDPLQVNKRGQIGLNLLLNEDRDRYKEIYGHSYADRPGKLKGKSYVQIMEEKEQAEKDQKVADLMSGLPSTSNLNTAQSDALIAGLPTTSNVGTAQSDALIAGLPTTSNVGDYAPTAKPVAESRFSQYKSDKARDSAIRAAKAAGRPLTSEESMYSSRREVQRNNADPKRAARIRKRQSPFTNIMDGAIKLGMGMIGGGGKSRVSSSTQNRGSATPRPSSRPSGFGVHSVSPKGQRVFTPTGSDGLPYYTTAVEGNRPTGMSFGGMSGMMSGNFQNPQMPIAGGMLSDLGLGPKAAGLNPQGITQEGATKLAGQAGLRTDIASFNNTGAAGRMQDQFNSQLEEIRKRRGANFGNGMAYTVTPNNQQQGMAPQLPTRGSSLLMASQQFGQQNNQSGGPMSMQLQGSQEITIRLPDIQAMINQNITGMIYSTVAQYFNQLASYVRNANNFEDLASTMSNGLNTTQTQQVGGTQNAR